MDEEVVRCTCTEILHYRPQDQTVTCPSCGREMMVSELNREKQKIMEELQRGCQAQRELKQTGEKLQESQERLHQAVSALEGLRHSQENEESILRDLSRQMGVDQEDIRGILQEMRREQTAGQHVLRELMERFQLVTDRYEALVTQGVHLDNAMIYLYALCAENEAADLQELVESDVDLSAEPLFAYAQECDHEEALLDDLLARNRAWRENEERRLREEREKRLEEERKRREEEESRRYWADLRAKQAAEERRKKEEEAQNREKEANRVRLLEKLETRRKKYNRLWAELLRGDELKAKALLIRVTCLMMLCCLAVAIFSEYMIYRNAGEVFEQLRLAAAITMTVYFIVAVTALVHGDKERPLRILIPVYGVLYYLARSITCLYSPLNDEEAALVRGQLSRESKLRRLKKEIKELRTELAKIDQQTLDAFDSRMKKPATPSSRVASYQFGTVFAAAALIVIFAAAYFYAPPLL